MLNDDFLRIYEAIQAYHPRPDKELLRKAYDFAREKHQGQQRASGEDYFHHLVETALLVCRLKLDQASVIAALLHDTLEDCSVTAAQLKEEFGEEVSYIVQGVTKLTRIHFETREETQAESFRKMLLAMAKDIRVVLVKLCDRLHNMRTLSHLPEDKQRRVALETKEIYAPLAHRLGIHWIKSRLEDLCLLHLRPEIYQLIKENLQRTKKDRDAYVRTTAEQISRQLEQAGISATVSGRSKHFYSIWEKMERNNISFDQVNDLHGFRVVVPTLRSCYETLGVIHAHWKPVPGRFKDYIAMPKSNMYQSLHTTVIGLDGSRIEIQIRTPEMHRIAEEGIAAHWHYKDTGRSEPMKGDGGFDLHWVNELVENQQYIKNPDEFIQSVKGELFPEDVFVFTPKGDPIRLPSGASTIDFAYAIHTDVGHHAVGAKVNGKLVSLDYQLDNGDTVEIVTSRNQVPSRDWLRQVCSTKAKQRIRSFLKSEEHARSMALGMEVFSKDLRKVKQSLRKLESSGAMHSLAESMGLKSVGDLYAQIGYGKLSTTKLITKLLPDARDLEGALQKTESPLERIFQRAAMASREKVGVKVSGVDDILIRFAKCCEPLPGDRITGFITRGRGVTVHRSDCSQVLSVDPLRRIDVAWDMNAQAPRKVRLTIHSQDFMGLLSDVSRAITDNGANISSAQVKTNAQGKAMHNFEITIDDAKQLDRLIRAIEQIKGVMRVDRRKRPFSIEDEVE